MCGVTAFVGKEVDKAKLKLIALANDDRGKHSCGIYADGKVLRGADKTARMPDLLINNILPNFKNPGLILCHSRFATIGAHSIKNSHPITIGLFNDKLTANDPDIPVELVGIHNGRLENYYDLRREYEDKMTLAEFDTDSKILFGCIYLNKEEPKKIFEKYIGAAVVLYTFDNENLFVFKGAAGGDEERPLFYIDEPEGTYFSSTEDPLWIIRTTDNPVVVVKENILWKFTKEGVVESAEVIARPHKLKTYVVEHSAVNYNKNKKAANNFIGPDKVVVPVNSSSFPDTVLRNLDKEAPNQMMGEVEFVNFRYQRNGKLLNGKHYISDHGFFKHGTLNMGEPYWFYEGILTDEAGWLEIAHRMLDTDDDLFQAISYLSRYPIFATHIQDCFRNKGLCDIITYKGKPYSGTVSPMFCDYYYTIEKGKFKNKNRRKVNSKAKLAIDQMFTKNKKGKTVDILVGTHHKVESESTL